MLTNLRNTIMHTEPTVNISLAYQLMDHLLHNVRSH